MNSKVKLGTWLRTLSIGRASCLFASDVRDALSVTTEAASSGEAPLRVVSLTWPTVPPLANELGQLVAALAKSVPDFAPELYGRRLQPGSPKWTQSSIEVEAQSIVREVREVQGSACRRILAAVTQGDAPALGKMAHAEQAQQLALAIEPTRLLVLIAVLAEPSDEEPLRSLAQGAEWLAMNTSSRVSLVLPMTLRGRQELDHVTYGARVFADAPEEMRAPSPAALQPSQRRGAKRGFAKPKETTSSVPAIDSSPVEGFPHPRSDAERHLHAEIMKDSRLRALFGYNRRVSTSAGETHTVDLLWEEGRLVIELDGISHRGAGQFNRDRVRDLHLLLTGYRVVRFTDERVLANTPWVLEQIRQLVRHCGKRESA